MATTDNRTAAQKKADLDIINKMPLRKKFNGAMAVSVIDDKVIIGYVSTNGQSVKTTMTNPTPLEFADKLISAVSNTHDTFRKDLMDKGDSIILHALTSESVRTPLAQNLSKGSKDVKVAKEVKQEILDASAARAAEIAELEAALADLRG